MSRSRTHPLVIVLILAVPALAALGHDLWMMTDPAKRGWDITRPFELSDLGWLWVTYAPDSFRFFHEFLPDWMWKGLVDPVLRSSSVFVLLVIPVIGFVVFVIKGFTGREKFVSFSFRDPDADHDSGRIKYKRK